ncbi:short-chain dehydrogenase/reductase [Apiospora phragmitis]|uniref:Short-chain dehydrogenase/reductase n=1 Tax=Apiospora phragmitis TaxID=2905665 RepID=A0ABR1VZP4_9PEZI
MDLASYDSVKAFAERADLELDRIDVLLENAAVVLRNAPPAVVINCTNPGLCKSELDGIQVRVAKFLLARTAEQGSRSLIAGAIGGPDTHGQCLDTGKVTTPATVVVGCGGDEAQARLYTELMEKLEKIVPGVTKNLSL